MGVEIVKAAVVHGRDLSGNAYKALICMALQALDKPKDGRPAGLYFGGWGALEVALGYEVGGPSSAGHTAVKRAIRELRDGEHLTPMITASRGTRQSYQLHPGGVEKGVTTDPKRGSGETLKGGQNTPESGSAQTLLGRTQDTEGLTQDISLPQQPEVQTARPKPPNGHKFEGRPGDDCEACGIGYTDRRAHPLHLLRGHA